MRPTPFAFAAAALLLAACGKPAAPPVEAPAAPKAAAEPAAEAAASPAFDAAALGLPTDADSIADGREIAVTQCSSCHALDQETSPRPGAPPLRYVLSIHNPESLAEDFRAGIHVGHPDMPDFEFGDLGMDVLLSYLISIQETPPAE
ncbi:cytochrome c [Hyphomonas sp.]|uniref:c-type cytochrome n=1 Tax=Hyphomonas sp. TaxID=87 RepID=UPI00334149B2